MLISPPFLPDRSADQAEDPWLDAALIGTGDGMFPISHRLGWHGGRHLAAPLDAAGGRLPVRAVADGKVLFVRQRTATDDRAHPLWYDRGYTSDAVVVIEHRTEIGADAQDRPVLLCFHSVYLHLHDVEKPVRVGQPVRRKDPIGSAGHIAGEPGRIHFEICLDGDNLARLAGRTAGDLPLARDGRDDVLYGAAYFRLPAGTPVYAAQPPLGASAVPPPARILARTARTGSSGCATTGATPRSPPAGPRARRWPRRTGKPTTANTACSPARRRSAPRCARPTRTSAAPPIRRPARAPARNCCAGVGSPATKP